jgi:GYF domain 2
MGRPGKLSGSGAESQQEPDENEQFCDVWYYADPSGQFGPYSLQQLKDEVAGLRCDNFYVWRDGMADWQRGSAVPELADADEKPGLVSIPGRVTLALVVSLFDVTLLGLHSRANSQPELPGPFPGLGAYSDAIKLGCGKQGANGARWNPKDIPFIGCFGLSSGSSVTGRLVGGQVEFAVDERGRENCKVDGVVVVQTVRQRTNVPNVAGGCGLLTFCVDAEHGDCTTSVTIISRNSDKSCNCPGWGGSVGCGELTR